MSRVGGGALIVKQFCTLKGVIDIFSWAKHSKMGYIFSWNKRSLKTLILTLKIETLLPYVKDFFCWITHSIYSNHHTYINLDTILVMPFPPRGDYLICLIITGKVFRKEKTLKCWKKKEKKKRRVWTGNL